MTAVLLATKTKQARAHACLVTLCRLRASAATRSEDGWERGRESSKPSSSFAAGTAFTVNLHHQAVVRHCNKVWSMPSFASDPAGEPLTYPKLSTASRSILLGFCCFEADSNWDCLVSVDEGASALSIPASTSTAATFAATATAVGSAT